MSTVVLEAIFTACTDVFSPVDITFVVLFIQSQASAVVDYATADEADHAVASVRGRLIAGQPVTATVAVAGLFRSHASTAGWCFPLSPTRS